MAELGPGVPTPLGRLMLRLTCGEASTDTAPHSRQHLGSYARQWRWPDVTGLRVDLVISSFAPSMSHLRVDAAIGCVWQWTATTDCPEVVIEAALPHAGDPASGECLEALEFETPDWQVALGGPDDDDLGQQVEAGWLPESWRGHLMPGCWDTDYGAVHPRPGALAWRLPGLRAGESARHHVAVAWRANDGDEQQAVAPWFAVDTTADTVLSAAGRHEG